MGKKKIFCLHFSTLAALLRWSKNQPALCSCPTKTLKSFMPAKCWSRPPIHVVFCCDVLVAVTNHIHSCCLPCPMQQMPKTPHHANWRQGQAREHQKEVFFRTQRSLLSLAVHHHIMNMCPKVDVCIVCI